jgi:hypothetical protein
MEPDEFDSLPTTPPPELEYETPTKPQPSGLDWNSINWMLLRLIRRVVFTIGAGVFFKAYGDTSGHSDIAGAMSTGGVLLALCIPLGRLPGQPRR